MASENAAEEEGNAKKAVHSLALETLVRLNDMTLHERTLVLSVICSEVSETDGTHGICWGRIPCRDQKS